jgi:quercetin dioxygenase-like cupin family protein
MRTGLRYLAAALVASACAYTATLRATPASGFVGTTLALGHLDEFAVFNRFPPARSDGHDGRRDADADGRNDEHGRDQDDRSGRDDAAIWLSMQRTKGQSDLYLQSNVWQPGGSTGWHTHPGHSLIIITAGAVTVYEGDDPTCTPHVYTAGMSLVDPGGDHVHLIRNEGSVEARGYAVQLIPAQATRRVDAAAPGFCPF